MSTWLTHRVFGLRQQYWANLCVVQLRLLLGFAFIPAGLKKILGQPFTDSANVGPFHEFLHAFRATGFFYQFVGALQLAAALLFLSQRFALAGAALALPLLTAILVFCWSTAVYPTAVVVSFMFLSTLALLVWELPRWGAVLTSARQPETARTPTGAPLYDTSLWQTCGFVIVMLYSAACAMAGEIYRPRGAEWDNPAFCALVLVPLCPLVTLALQHKRRTG